jgi:hypothetical protein
MTSKNPVNPQYFKVNIAKSNFMKLEYKYAIENVELPISAPSLISPEKILIRIESDIVDKNVRITSATNLRLNENRLHSK